MFLNQLLLVLDEEHYPVSYGVIRESGFFARSRLFKNIFTADTRYGEKNREILTEASPAFSEGSRKIQGNGSNGYASFNSRLMGSRYAPGPARC